MTTTTTGVGNKGDDQPAWVALAKAALGRVTEKFLANTKADLKALGPLANTALEEIEKLLEAGAKTGDVKKDLILGAYQKLRAAYLRDQAQSFDVGDPPSRSVGTQTKIPSGRREHWATPIDDKEKRFQIGGLVGAEHLLTALLKKVGFDPASVPAHVISLIASFGQHPTRSNLTDPAVWKDLGARLRGLALDEGLGGVSGTSRPRSSGTPVEGSDEGAAHGGLGLERTAGRRSNTGSATNATAIRAALLSGTKANANIEQIAQQLTDLILKDLKAGDVSAELKAQVTAGIKEALRDPKDPTRPRGPLDVLAAAYRITMEKLPADAERSSFMLGQNFAIGLAEIVRGQKLSPGMERAFLEAGSWGLVDMATALLGKPPQKASFDLQDKMTGILRELSKTSVLAEAMLKASGAHHDKKAKSERKERTEAGDAPKPDETRKEDEVHGAGHAGERPTAAEVEAAIQKFLETTKLDPSRADVQRFVGALREIFAYGVDPASVAVSGVRWLVGKGALPPNYLDQAESTIAHKLDNLKTAKERHAEINARVDEAEERKEKATDPGEKARIQNEVDGLREMQAERRKFERDLVDGLKTQQNEVLAAVGEFLDDPERFKRTYNSGGGGGGRGGGGGGIGGGGGGDDWNGGGPGEPNWFRRDQPQRAALPGLFSDGRPGEHPGDLTLQQQRAMKCSAILADPSLCIEDKVFLFMMWFIAFTDRERENKMEEITGMDRRQAARQEEMDKLRQKGKSNNRELGDVEKAIREINGEMKKLQKDSPQYKELAGKKAELEANREKLSDYGDVLTGQIGKLKRDSDSAPQSREVKFTELQRLSQLRDNILNMARNIMETSNRNIEKVFR